MLLQTLTSMLFKGMQHHQQNGTTHLPLPPLPPLLLLLPAAPLLPLPAAVPACRTIRLALLGIFSLQ